MSEDDNDENMLCGTIIASLASSKKERWSNNYNNSFGQ